MPERGSTHHSPRVDDELAHETESLTRGAPLEPRAEEWRQQEAPGDGEPLADARVAGSRFDEPPGTLDLDEIEDRSLLAISLRPSAFPGDRTTLTAVALEEHADPRVLEWLEHLPAERSFATVQEVWESLGGRWEQRTVEEIEVAAEPEVPAPTPPKSRVEPIESPAPASAPRSPVAPVAPEHPSAPERVVGLAVSVATLPVRLGLSVLRRVRALVR